MDKLKEEMMLVKRLGEQIGYGNMIQCAEALWNERLKIKRFNDVISTYEQCAKELNQES